MLLKYNFALFIEAVSFFPGFPRVFWFIFITFALINESYKKFIQAV